LERRKSCSENVIPDVGNQPKEIAKTIKSQILGENDVVGLEGVGEEDSESQKQPQPQKKEKTPELENYVIGPEKFPISKGRWGYLPTAIQKILMEVNYKCQISKNNTNIRPDHTCLVRHGVESDMNQSFIGCIADAIFFTKLDEDKQPMQIPTIKKMKEIIIESLTIDSYLTFQNGDLVNTFMVDAGMGGDVGVDSKKIEKYTDSNLYKKTDADNGVFYNKVVKSFENFIEFLRSSDGVIDYTYLWDIVCRPNPLLFKSGINLVILEIPNNDITNNVDFICPTNHYSSHLFDGKKPTLLLIKQESFFEPIYSYRFNKSSETLFIGKLFSEYDTKLSVTMRDFFKKVVKPYIQNMCVPIPSIPNLYKMTQPILLDELLYNLDKIKYDLLQQVVNYQNKVIGVVVVNGGKSNDRGNGFIPCYPSAINDKYDYQFMTDKDIWNAYGNTLYYLLDVYKESKGKIPCNPVLKIVEDEMVVGFLTQTNQVVQLSEPVSIESEEIKDDLPLLKDQHYVVNRDGKSDSDVTTKLKNVDVSIALSNRVDTERVEYIKKIRMEYEFYQVFRTTIRILLNDYENIKLRESIESEIKKTYILYYSKIEIIKNLLKELVERKTSVIFTDNYNYDMIKEITTCVTRSTGTGSGTGHGDSGEKNKCAIKSPLCIVSDNGNTCQLILPKKNLVTGKNNELIYYEKMADELIRYIRINKYIFEPKSYLSFENMGYNLNDNEILLFQSLITQEYFEGLIPAIQNKYVKHNTYDSVEPILTEHYDNAVKYDPNKLIIHVPTVGPVGSVTIPIEVPSVPAQPFASTPPLVCKSVINDKISSGIWKKCFPNGCGEKEYDKTVECTFQVLVDIGINLSINSIRKQLYDEYKKYLPTYEGQILDILMGQGKKSLVGRVKSKIITFHDLLFSESYYLTTLDYWILLTKFRISSFFISSKYLFDTKYMSNNMLVFDDEVGDTFAFIVIPAIVNDIVPAYKLIVNKKESNTAFISLKEFNDCEGRNELMVTIDEKETTGLLDGVDQYIKNFTRVKTTVYKKKQPKLEMEEPLDLIGQNEEIRVDKDDSISSSKSIEVTAPKNVDALRKKANGTKKNVVKKIVNRRQHTEKKTGTGAIAKKPLLITAEE
jgi:hypothetical protein